jgi:hypothetical protein
MGADADLQNLEAWIQKHEESRARFQDYLSRIGQLRAAIRRDMEAVRALDILRRARY